LRLIVQRLDFVHLVNIEDVIIANFLQKLEKQWPLCLGSPLGNSLVQIGIQIGLLHDLADDIGVADRLDVQIVTLRQLGILDPLLPQGELQHFDSSD